MRGVEEGRYKCGEFSGIKIKFASVPHWWCQTDGVNIFML